ncbi:hypothetical protein FACS1894122_11990 [Alphaproteobacteria bacterium]|nr:hypothetical protein FACS1894122_11990 [Alphaproteobacteria bacterium]
MQKEIDNFKGLGITSIKRTTQLIVSLTSYPERMYDMHFALYSLLNQTLKPDAIVLWLSKEEFPNGEKEVPDNVLKMREHGVAIKFYEKNIRQFLKFIPSLKEYPDEI